MGLALVLSLGVVAAWRNFQLWWRRSRQRAVSLGVLPLASLSAIGLHSFVDFSPHIPANCLLLAAVLTIGHKALNFEKSNPPLRNMDPALDEIQSTLDWDGWNAAYYKKYALKLMSEPRLAGFSLPSARPDRLNRRPEPQQVEAEAADLWQSRGHRRPAN